MRTCNYTVDAGLKPYEHGGPRPKIICGKPALYSLPPNHRLLLCLEHAAMNWGSPGPEPLSKEPGHG